MNNEFKQITNGNEVRYVLEDGGSITTGAIATVEKSLGELQRRAEPPKPRNFVAKNAKMGGAGQHKDKKKAEKQGSVKHKKPYMEGFNGEYDDEAGMAKTNLHTIARAAQGLLDTIDNKENLPEWTQEKLAKVEGMLVAVWDYLKSQEEQGIDPRMGEGNSGISKGAETKFHSKLDRLVHNTFGKRKSEQGVAEDPYFNMLERSVSQAQHNLMVGVAHNPQFAQKVKVKQSVGQEFANADQGHDISALPIRVPKKK